MGKFLSCLCGSERLKSCRSCLRSFLSCLCGSELDKNPPNPLILKELSPPTRKYPKFRGIRQVVDLKGGPTGRQKKGQNQGTAVPRLSP